MTYARYCVALTIAALFIGSPVHAGWGFCKPDGCQQECAECCTPACCHCEVKKVKVTKHCYDVECEQICIPPVCLPKCCLFGNGDDCGAGCDSCTDDCCGSGCTDCGEGCGEDCCRPGFLARFCSVLTRCRVRNVRSLKKNERELEKCVCEWSVTCGCGDGCAKYCEPECCPPATCCAPCGEF